jgi:hypothetical protein
VFVDVWFLLITLGVMLIMCCVCVDIVAYVVGVVIGLFAVDVGYG